MHSAHPEHKSSQQTLKFMWKVLFMNISVLIHKVTWDKSATYTNTTNMFIKTTVAPLLQSSVRVVERRVGGLMESLITSDAWLPEFKVNKIVFIRRMVNIS